MISLPTKLTTLIAVMLALNMASCQTYRAFGSKTTVPATTNSIVATSPTATTTAFVAAPTDPTRAIVSSTTTAVPATTVAAPTTTTTVKATTTTTPLLTTTTTPLLTTTAKATTTTVTPTVTTTVAATPVIAKDTPANCRAKYAVANATTQICATDGMVYSTLNQAKCVNPGNTQLFACKMRDRYCQMRCIDTVKLSTASCSALADSKVLLCANDGLVYAGEAQKKCVRSNLRTMYACPNVNQKEACQKRCLGVYYVASTA